MAAVVGLMVLIPRHLARINQLADMYPGIIDRDRPPGGTINFNLEGALADQVG